MTFGASPHTNLIRTRQVLLSFQIVALLCLIIPAQSATPPRAGEKCAQEKSIIIYKGKKYTCVKDIRKLIWNSGVPVNKTKPSPKPLFPSVLPKASASPSATPSRNANNFYKDQPCNIEGTYVVYDSIVWVCKKSLNGQMVWNNDSTPIKIPLPVPTPKKDLSLDKYLTPNSELSDLSICKTLDLTNRQDVSNGFPRPASAKNGKVDVKILFVPISFTDFTFTDEDLARNKQVTLNVRDFYLKTSYGKVSINFEFLDKKYWVNMERSANSYNLVDNKPQQNNTQVVEDALIRVDSAINFDQYDAVVVESGRFQSTGGGQGFPGQTFKTKNGQAKSVSLEFGYEVANFKTLAHELGHSLFNLEDLYVFLNASRPSVPDPNPAGSWDMMSNSSPEFFGWNKFLNGWIASDQVRCIDTQIKTNHYLENIAISGSNPKLVLINQEAGVTIAVEARSDSLGLGVLAYKIDTHIPHGDGPIIAQKELLRIGSKVLIDGWQILVKDTDANGVLVEIIRI